MSLWGDVHEQRAAACKGACAIVGRKWALLAFSFVGAGPASAGFFWPHKRKVKLELRGLNRASAPTRIESTV